MQTGRRKHYQTDCKTQLSAHFRVSTPSPQRGPGGTPQQGAARPCPAAPNPSWTFRGPGGELVLALVRQCWDHTNRVVDQAMSAPPPNKNYKLTHNYSNQFPFARPSAVGGGFHYEFHHQPWGGVGVPSLKTPTLLSITKIL